MIGALSSPLHLRAVEDQRRVADSVFDAARARNDKRLAIEVNVRVK